jgi:3-methyladenine DNA glycosylase AlkD
VDAKAIDAIIERLRALGDEKRNEQATRFGVRAERRFGVRMPDLRKLARELGRDHQRSLELWRTGWQDARHLAILTAEPKKLTEEQLEAWAADFDAWDIVDNACGSLIDKTPLARPKLRKWIRRPEEYVRRAGYVLMATLAVHDKKAPDDDFLGFLELIEAAEPDPRNFVWKAVDWAIRQIGKRNPALNTAARRTAAVLAADDAPTRRRIGRIALKELEGAAVQERLRKRQAKRAT